MQDASLYYRLNIELAGNLLVHKRSNSRERWDDLLKRVGRSVIGEAVNRDDEHSPVTAFAAQVAEVSVDVETGEVKLLKLTTAHDTGHWDYSTGFRCCADPP